MLLGEMSVARLAELLVNFSVASSVVLGERKEAKILARSSLNCRRNRYVNLQKGP
jgi:hypothetical protein